MSRRTSLNRLSTPRRVVVGDHEAYFWDVTVDGVPSEVAWWVSDGSLRLSFPCDDTRRSRFVRLGSRYSPRRSLVDADAAVHDWAAGQRRRMAS